MSALKGGDKIIAHLQGLAQKLGNGDMLRVGFFATETYPDEAHTPVAQVAFWNEYGTKKSPPRPFFRSMISEKSPGWGAALGKNLIAKNYDAKAALRVVGEGIAGQVSDSIRNFAAPENSAVTNLLKQRFPTRDGMTFGDVLKARADVAAGASAPAGHPLIWSGILLNSVRSRVDDE